MATAQTIIDDVLRKIGILGDGEAATASMAANALTVLNDMIAEWSADSLLIFSQTLENFPLVAADGVYTIGAGGQFNTVRPHSIVTAYVRDSGGTDYPLDIINRDQYNAEPSKSVSGRPNRLYYDSTLTLGTIYLLPVPTTAETIYIDSIKPFTQFATLGSTASFPDEYLRPIKLGFQLDLSDEYHIPISENLFRRAEMAKSKLKRMNWRPTYLKTELSGQPYNINNA